MKNLGLYFHFPFCESKCSYCDFYSVVGCEDKETYLEAMMLQCEDYSDAAKEYAVDTVFFGGGTPTTVPARSICDLIDCIYENFNVALDAEFTIEANPATVTKQDLKRLLKSGVNRISFGLQSANDKELDALSRIHNFEEFVESYNLARDVGFENINIDVMYGIPNQTMDSFRDTLDKVIALEPEHISLYNLKIEPNTPMGAIKDTLVLPDEDMEYRMYEYAILTFAQNDYVQYEISNFARKGYECKHNLKYWQLEPYIGIGAAAHSYFRDKRFSFVSDINRYIDCVMNEDCHEKITDECYTITPKERVGEYIMLSLRLKKGVDLLEFSNTYGLDFERMYEDLLPVYVENGFMLRTREGYAFTPKGMYVSNYILSSMLDFSSEIDKNIANGSDK